MAKTWKVNGALARMLDHAITDELPGISVEWSTAIKEGSVTEEMLTIFKSLGWISSTRDPRITPNEVSVVADAATPPHRAEKAATSQLTSVPPSKV